jgi:hypothetical protein
MKNTKICNKCNVEKDLCEFHKKKDGKDGIFPICKICRKIDAKKYYKKYHNKNLERSKIWVKKNPEKRKELTKKYREKNNSKLKEDGKLYRLINKEKEKERLAKYYKNNKEKVLNRNKSYNKKRLKDDKLFKLKSNMRNRVKKFLKLNNIHSENRTFDIVGCEPKFLKEYIEQKFTEGMCWDLVGKEIHIDHIIPLSSANTEEDIYKLCHYTNLQPLWAKDNMSKSDKIL